MLYPKIFIGPMSKTIVDAIVESGADIALIPSRRQVDYNRGYVNHWTTTDLRQYVPSRILIERDHGGPNQGKKDDNGIVSLRDDCELLNIIHIDPWKVVTTFEHGCWLTGEYIKFCCDHTSVTEFEVGTEEAIYPYSARDLDYLLKYLHDNLPKEDFDRVRFAVIQSGTSLKENENTGVYDRERLKEMVAVCRKWNVLSKEHNGDYLPIEQVSDKFVCGLNAINIAPEFAQIETKIYLEKSKTLNLFDLYYEVCYQSGKWKKWVDSSFVPEDNKEKLVNICGHYVLSHYKFQNDLKEKLQTPETILEVNAAIKHKIKELMTSL